MQVNTEYLLRSAAPAALATAPREGLSEAYSFFDTRALVDALETDNWTVTEARQAGGRYTPIHTRKHQLTIADRDVAAQKGIGEYPRVLLSNSHDGNAACKLQAGLWRMICSNGIVISDGFIQSVSIKHSRRTIEEVVQAAQAFRANAGRIGEHVVKFKEVKLTPAAAVEFAKQALRLRFGEAPSVVVKPQDILSLQRTEDSGNDLWSVFNVAQEWLLKGGFPVTKVEPLFQSTVRHARPIKSIDDSGRLNTGLWDLAEQFSLN
jgi:Domain of unknown function (DUF932).